ncbi:hypothetical protein M0R72_04455 [Candidatus Pacearchaeota archaeon]|jgi:hypothetical protein|nr:hypothetical protein [Candidatus Pacearchaeota archaeon]
MIEERKYYFFRGKYSTIKEAEEIITQIENGEIQPTETELLDYQHHKDEEVKCRKSLNGLLAKIAYKNKDIQLFKEEITIQDYLIMKINEKIGLVNYCEKINYCEEHGHKFDKNTEYISSGTEGTMVNGTCPRCSDSYQRPLTFKEGENFHKRMNTPFTI